MNTNSRKDKDFSTGLSFICSVCNGSPQIWWYILFRLLVFVFGKQVCEKAHALLTFLADISYGKVKGGVIDY